MGRICLAVFALAAVALCVGTWVAEDGAVSPNSGILIDVRTAGEFAGGHLHKAINVPHTVIGDRIGALVTNKADRIVLYCRSGNRSGIALATLRAMGYTNVVNAGAYSKLRATEDEAGPANARNSDR